MPPPPFLARKPEVVPPFSLEISSTSSVVVQPPKTTHEFSSSEFAWGFAQGLPSGLYESGRGWVGFLTDLAVHPSNTIWQAVSAIETLVTLAGTAQWDALSEAIAPEVCQLVKEWDTLPSEIRGKKAGEAFGRYGSDMLLPGGIAKLSSKGVKGAQKLNKAYNSLRTAEQQVLVLEYAGGPISTVVLRDVIRAERTSALVEGMNSAVETLPIKFHDPILQSSYEMFERAEVFLKPHVGEYLPESQIRQLVRQAGLPEMPRPLGIPDNYRVKLSLKGGGIKYIHPTDEGTCVRVMPGKPHSPLPHQQNPYVLFTKNGRFVDEKGNFVPNKSPESHIPLKRFKFNQK